MPHICAGKLLRYWSNISLTIRLHWIEHYETNKAKSMQLSEINCYTCLLSTATPLALKYCISCYNASQKGLKSLNTECPSTSYITVLRIYSNKVLISVAYTYEPRQTHILIAWKNHINQSYWHNLNLSFPVGFIPFEASGHIKLH